MKTIALAGNPNSGKTTLFNAVTGSTAHVGNWPGVTVDKKTGLYKKEEEPITLVDLPGIYSLSPYTDEEVISRNFLLEEKPDCIINIVDVTNLERNLYLTLQLMEIDIPIVCALNMSDVLAKEGKEFDLKKLEEILNIPVVMVSALKENNIEELMHRAYQACQSKRKARSCLKGTSISHLIGDVTIAFEALKVDYPLFHAIKLIENDELELKDHSNLVSIIDNFKMTFNDNVLGNDLEAVIADERYKYITSFSKKLIIAQKKEENTEFLNSTIKTKSDKVDKVLTHKFFGIPIFIAILFVIFHLTFSEDLFFLNALGLVDITSFAGTPYEGLFANGGISSIGVIFTNLFNNTFDLITSSIANGMNSANVNPVVTGLVCDGIITGVFSVFGFLPQILLLFLCFSILEDSGYMARVAFILDRIMQKFGVTGRAFLPMIMGFGCSIPAMINTRTLADDKEKIATIRVIPFFSCGAKLPILSAVSGALVSKWGIGNADLITLLFYAVGMITAMISLIILRSSTLKGEKQPFMMELPNYHMPRFKSLMLHLWDKAKHFIKKACTIILLSNVIVWVLIHFSPTWTYLEDAMINESILAVLSKMVQPLFTPLGFGSQLKGFGWVFVSASIAGLIAKENIVGLFAVLAAVISSADPDLMSDIGSVGVLIENTGATFPALFAFIMFNMTTIPCFAACATARGELKKGTFKWTILFWLVTSYIVGTICFVSLTVLWTIPIFIAVIAAVLVLLYLYRIDKISFRKKESK